MRNGTSPRTRGKLAGFLRGSSIHRNIPAHAGKTSMISSPSFFPSEHPRARGENSVTPSPTPQTAGTSPRTRGKPHLNTVSAFSARNIPAHAGKTADWGAAGTPLPEHPRARGENIFRQFSRPKSAGTSPRTRGKRCSVPPRRSRRRNIPAHAGKTATNPTIGYGKTEHPRARGENFPRKSSRFRYFGTSPRTRGKLQGLSNLIGPLRNIPAHAGKTSLRHRCSRTSRGTSPRTRGKHLLTCGSSFLKVILHSVLFSRTMGV